MRITALVLLIILVTTLLGCSQSDRVNNNPKYPQESSINQSIPKGFLKVKKAPQKPNKEIGRTLSVVSPQSCFNLLPSYRSISYTEKNCIKLGKDYESSLPNNLIEFCDESIIFHPNNLPNDKVQTPSYCVFRFSIPDYDQNPTIGFSWGYSDYFENRPNGWVGLGNNKMKAWDWYQMPADNVLTLESFEPYLSANGDLLVTIAVTGNDLYYLDRLNLGVYELVTTGLIIDEYQIEEKPDLFIDPNLPSAFDISTDGVPIGDQLDWGACAVFAICQEAYNHELTRIYHYIGWDPTKPKFQPSPKYVYVESGSCGPDIGRYLSSTLDSVIFEFGDSSEESVPYNTDSSDKNWVDSAYKDSKYFRYDHYVYLNPKNVEELKMFISNGYPVITGSFIDIWWNGGLVKPNEKVWIYSGTAYSRHAYCIVGYDDKLKAFKIQNSWGEDWCDNGYKWISYKNFTDYSDALKFETIVLFDNYSPELVKYLGLTPADIQPPVNVRASQGTIENGIQISWNKVPKAIKYNIYRDSSKNLIKTVENDTSFFDTTVTDARSHFYWVQAVNSTNSSELSTLAYGYREATTWNGFEIDPYKLSLEILPSNPTIYKTKNEKIKFQYKLYYDGIAVDNPESPLFHIAQADPPVRNWSCDNSIALIPDIATFYSSLAEPNSYTVSLILYIPTNPQIEEYSTDRTEVMSSTKIIVK